MLYTTRIQENTDETYQQFINICKDVLPIEIEKPYVSLANSVSYYLTLGATMNYENESLEQQFKNEELAKSIGEISIINNKIREIISKNPLSSEDYQTLMSLSKRGNLLSLEREKISEFSLSNGTMHIQALVSNESQDMLNKIIFGIIAITRSISDLEHKGKTLDSLKIKEKHINEIEKLNLSTKGKETAYDILNQFLKSRINAFKIIGDFTFLLLEKYKNNDNHISGELYEKYQLSMLALEVLTLNDFSNPKNSKSFENDDFKDVLYAIKIYNSYVSNEEITIKISRDKILESDPSIQKLLFGLNYMLKQKAVLINGSINM